MLLKCVTSSECRYRYGPDEAWKYRGNGGCSNLKGTSALKHWIPFAVMSKKFHAIRNLQGCVSWNILNCLTREEITELLVRMAVKWWLWTWFSPTQVYLKHKYWDIWFSKQTGSLEFWNFLYLLEPNSFRVYDHACGYTRYWGHQR